MSGRIGGIDQAPNNTINLVVDPCRITKGRCPGPRKDRPLLSSKGYWIKEYDRLEVAACLNDLYRFEGVFDCQEIVTIYNTFILANVRHHMFACLAIHLNVVYQGCVYLTKMSIMDNAI